MWDYKRGERFLIAPPPHPSLGSAAPAAGVDRNHLLESNEVLACCWLHQSLGMLSVEVDVTSASHETSLPEATFEVTLRFWSATPANQPQHWGTEDGGRR